MSPIITRRDTLVGAAALTVAASATSSGQSIATSGAGSQTPATASSAADASWRNPDLIRHLQSAAPLVNHERARAIMDKYQLDGLVASVPHNVYYLSSHRGPMQMMGRSFSFYAFYPRREDAPAALIVPGSMVYHLDYRPTWMPSVQVYSFGRKVGDTIVPDAYVAPWARRAREDSINQADRVLMAIYAEYHGKTSESALAGLKRSLVEGGVTTGNIGFDDPRVLPWLQAAGLPKLRGVDALNIFREIRMVKTENEIAILRQAAQKGEAALDYAIEQIKPGHQVEQIEVDFTRCWGELGGNALWVVANIRGLNSGLVSSGDFMKLDSVGEYLGYRGDIGRTVAVGEPGDELVRRIEANRRASDAVYASIRPGMKFSKANAIFGDVMRQNGFTTGLCNAHPVGLEHTDHPWPTGAEAPDSVDWDLTFENGMVFTLDMPYHEVGWGTTHVEDMMVVRPGGAVPLSSGNISLRRRPG